MGIEKMRKLQLGLENPAGIAVPATAIWRGPTTSIKDGREIVRPDENVGLLVKPDRQYTPVLGAEYPMPDTEATYEQLPYILSAGVKDLVAGEINGGVSNGFIYAYPFPTTTADAAIKKYTLEAGDDNQAYEMEYSFVETFDLSGSVNSAIKVGAAWRGRQKIATTFTGSLSLPTVEEMLFNKGKLYLDAIDGTLGATQKLNTWLGFTYKVKTGWQFVHTGDGNLYFSFLKCVGATITGSLILEYDSIATALEEDFAARTPRLLRMSFPGSALTGSGGTHLTKIMNVDTCISVDSIDQLSARDGNDTLQINWTAVYNTTPNLFSMLTICNTLATLP